MDRSRMILVIAVFCGAVQLINAARFRGYQDTPNVSTSLAQNLVRDGRYEVWTLRLRGPDHSSELLRCFHLPGEALFLAFWFRVLPAGLYRYIHVPVTTALVVSVAYVASWISDAWLGLLAGLFASVQPFVVFHGSIWEDTFLAAALIWLGVALLCSKPDVPHGASGVRPLLLFAIAGWASITRMEAQTVFLLLAGATFVVPALRRLRREGIAIALGVLIALCLWGLRNRAAIGEFVVGTSHDGITFWWSNCEYTKQALRKGQVEAVYENVAVTKEHWDRTASMTETEVNRYYTRLAIQYILGHPLDFFTTAALKLFLSLLGLAPEQPLAGARNLIAVISSAVTLLLSVSGIGFLKKRLSRKTYSMWRCLLVVIGIPGLFMLLIGPIGLRYYITAQGLLWIASAAAIQQLARFAFARGRVTPV